MADIYAAITISAAAESLHSRHVSTTNRHFYFAGARSLAKRRNFGFAYYFNIASKASDIPKQAERFPGPRLLSYLSFQVLVAQLCDGVYACYFSAAFKIAHRLRLQPIRRSIRTPSLKDKVLWACPSEPNIVASSCTSANPHVRANILDPECALFRLFYGHVFHLGVRHGNQDTMRLNLGD